MGKNSYKAVFHTPDCKVRRPDGMAKKVRAVSIFVFYRLLFEREVQKFNRRCRNAGKDHIGLPGVQTEKLQHHEEQEKRP